MSDKIEAATDATYEETVVESDLPVLVDFWAPWCGPCRAVGPVLEQIAEKYAGKVKVVKVNVDENQQIAASLGVRSIPMIVLYSGGQIQETVIGARGANFFEGILDKLLDG